MAAFDCTYLLQMTSQLCHGDGPEVAIVGGRWSPFCGDYASVKIVEGLETEIRDIPEATDMSLWLSLI